MRTSFAEDNVNRELEVFIDEAEEVGWSAPDGAMLDLLVPPTVYPPGEDTGILCDSVLSLGPGNGRSLLEIGCGSGAVSLWAAMRGFRVFTCDINPLAVSAVRGRAEEMGLSSRLTVVEGGPGEGKIEQWAQGKHDVIIWNPPYLDPPSEGDPVLGPLEEAGMVDLDWKQGSGVVLLDAIEEGDLLNDDGIVLIIRSSTTIGRYLGEEAIGRGWAQRSAVAITFDDGEHLEVLAFWRPWNARPVEEVGIISSTNSLMLEQGGKIGRCIKALNQTKGRGQRDSKWVSKEGDLLCSWLVPVNDAGILQLSAGIALMQSLDSIEIHQDEKINHWMKWPNDVWIGKRKFAGCLAEGKSKGRENKFVIGIGANFMDKDEDFPIATIEHQDKDFQKRLDAALAGLLESKQGVPNVGNDEIIELAWGMMSAGLSNGQEIQLSKQTGSVVGLTNEGHLLVEFEDGVKEISATDGIQFLI
jgi:BirA family biotin operon repressor/biotin-[acetyl-CoA-carboxylase] ligase